MPAGTYMYHSHVGLQLDREDGFRVTALLDTVALPDPAANYQVQHTPRIMLVDRSPCR